jgi:hypothetical protein
VHSEIARYELALAGIEQRQADQLKADQLREHQLPVARKL